MKGGGGEEGWGEGRMRDVVLLEVIIRPLPHIQLARMAKPGAPIISSSPGGTVCAGRS